jgi:predicted nucleotidyltransferase
MSCLGECFVADKRDLPVLAERAVVLDALFGSDPIWSAVVDIAGAMRQDEWLLIGGQMVALHGFIAGAVPPRATTDIDIVADVMVRAGALQRCAAVLEALHFDPQPSITGRSLHRFVGARGSVDLLVPDHLPATVSARLRGYSAVPIVGGRRALNRAGLVPVVLGDRRVDVVTPDLQGALVLKARAASADRRDTERHLSDLAFLSSLVADPLAMATAIDGNERRSLRRIALGADTRFAPWVFLPADVRQDAADAWRALCR